jgi:transcriptional regulator with XRE-family HTH domain
MTKFADWIAKKGLTEVETARLVGVSQAQISRIKRGLSKPSPVLAERLQTVTGIPAWDFIRPGPVSHDNNPNAKLIHRKHPTGEIPAKNARGGGEA